MSSLPKRPRHPAPRRGCGGMLAAAPSGLVPVGVRLQAFRQQEAAEVILPRTGDPFQALRVQFGPPRRPPGRISPRPAVSPCKAPVASPQSRRRRPTALRGGRMFWRRCVVLALLAAVPAAAGGGGKGAAERDVATVVKQGRGTPE